MKKFVLLLAALGLALTGLPAMADMHGCDVAAPAEPVQVNFIGWTFPILDFYASEIESCNQVENLDVNAQVLQSADAQNEMRLAASSTGASPYDIVHGSNAFIGAVENTTGNALNRVRIEVHLSNGTELGPTTPVDLAPGEVIAVNLQATQASFTGWVAHAEVGGGEVSGEHGSIDEHRSNGEHGSGGERHGGG